ncbi:MAG: response regulator, partial [Caldilinea sp.]
MNNAHVLLLEDDSLWVDSVREVVAPHVQTFHAAASLMKATSLIESHYFTVAIVDISLIGGDPKDSQGMEFLRMLAERKLDDVVAVIILSAYGDMDRLRKAFRDFHVYDFLSKINFQASELIEAIRGTLEEHGRLENLTIEVESRRQLASLWERFDWPQRETPQELINELGDLLRRLFPGATDLFLQPMPAGQSGAVVVKAEPIYSAKRGSPVIVKFGKRDKIEVERDNYDAHIERFISNQASTRLRYVPGRVMGAIAYSLVGPDLGGVMALAEYFPKASEDDLRRVFDNLFLHTCRRWYENREQPRRTRDLVELYENGLHIHDWGVIWQGMEKVTPDLATSRLSFPGVEGDFPNPKAWLAARNHQIYLPVWLATTHGDLNEHNVLVTDDNRTWLIDFYRTGT